MNAFDASYFESSISNREGQIEDPRRDISVRILRLWVNSHYLANICVGFLFSAVSSCSL
jgi:hypothetical protein